MEFTEFISGLHRDHLHIDPQFAQIEEGTVVYAFRLFGMRVEDVNRHGIKGNFYGESFLRPMDYDSIAKVTKAYASELKDRLLQGMSAEVTERSEILIHYKPKTEREIEEIRRFLEGIPEDGGNLPEKGANFFCYD